MTRRRLFQLVGALALLGGVVPLAVRQLERRSTFRPQSYDPRQPWELPDRARELWFDTEDGVTLHGWLLAGDPQPVHGALIYFHGNAGYIPTYLPAVERLRALGFDVLLWDYRGFGRSGGTPRDESALYLDGTAALRAMTEATGLPADRLVFYGHSLGTAVASEMALRHGCRALILQAPLASIRQHIAYGMPWLPDFLAGLAVNRFETARKIADLKCPLFVIHGERDRTIPVVQGLAVFQAAPEPKRLKLYPNGEHVLGDTTGWAHLQEIQRFVAEMAP